MVIVTDEDAEKAVLIATVVDVSGVADIYITALFLFLIALIAFFVKNLHSKVLEEWKLASLNLLLSVM